MMPDDANLTPDDVAALKGVSAGGVRQAALAGRLKGYLEPSPPSKNHPLGGGRFFWRFRREDAEAWDPDIESVNLKALPPADITIRPGPKEADELSPLEAAARKGVASPTVFNAIRKRRIPCRFAPRDTHLHYPVPRPGPSRRGRWYLKIADVDAWIPGKKREGGAYERQGPPGKADDEVTVTEAAKIKGRRPPTILTAIWDGRLPARWVPREIPIAPPLTVPYTEGEQGWWLIRKEDLEAYTPLTKDEMRAKGQETHKRGERSKRKK